MDDDLSARVYEAAAIPELWPAVLQSLGGLIDARAAGIISIDRSAGVRFLTTEKYAGPYEGFSAQGVQHRNIRAERAIASGYSGFLPDVELCTVEELQVDPMYTQFLYRFGLSWTMGASVTAPGSDITYFDFGRETGQTPFSRADAEVMDGYRPVLGRAALLSIRLGLEEARSTARALSTIGLAGAVIADGGRVLAANPEFTALAPRLDVVAFDRLVVADADATILLAAAFGSEATAIGSIPIKAEGDAPPLVLHLVPVRRGARDVFVRAAWVVIVTPVVTAEAPAAEILAGLFDLTPAEARVARLIAGGGSVETVAVDHHVSEQTVRNQLRAVLQKTGTHRQSELVRLLLSARPIRS